MKITEAEVVVDGVAIEPESSAGYAPLIFSSIAS